MRINEHPAGMNNDAGVIPFAKAVRKRGNHLIKKISSSRYNEVRFRLPKKNQALNEDEIPMHKWIMPLEPQRYLKFPDYDYL